MNQTVSDPVKAASSNQQGPKPVAKLVPLKFYGLYLAISFVGIFLASNNYEGMSWMTGITGFGFMFLLLMTLSLKTSKGQNLTFSIITGLLFAYSAANQTRLEPADQRQAREASEKQEAQQEAANQDKLPPLVGCEGVVNRNSYVAISQSALDAMLKCGATNDTLGIAGLVANKYLVGLKAGTKILVLDRTGDLESCRKIRVLNGPRRARVFYLPMEWVSKK